MAEFTLKVRKFNLDTGQPQVDGDGNAVMLEGAEAIEQNIKMRYFAHKHTWYADQDFGPKWRGDIGPKTKGLIGERTRPHRIAMALVPDIEKTAGVERVLDVQVKKNTDAETANREMTIEWVIDVGLADPVVVPFERPDGFLGGP